MSEKLLPPRSGPWTRAVAYTFDTNRRISYATVQIKSIGITDFPEDWLPWLIYEYGLEDVVPYIRTLRQALQEGRIWQKRRGTPDGIRIGIGWVESQGEVAPPDGRHNWWEFQVAFDEPPKDLEQIRQLYGIINLSKASEDELFRMYSPGHDVRPVRMDEHRYDDGMMDDYSGEPGWEDGPYLSFGVAETVVLPWDVEITTGSSFVSTRTLDWFEGMSFDQAVGDDERPVALISGSETYEGTSTASSGRDDTWPERWPSAPWNDMSEPFPFVAVSRNDSKTILVTYKDDVWPDSYPETWDSEAGARPVPTPLETT